MTQSFNEERPSESRRTALARRAFHELNWNAENTKLLRRPTLLKGILDEARLSAKQRDFLVAYYLEDETEAALPMRLDLPREAVMPLLAEAQHKLVGQLNRILAARNELEEPPEANPVTAEAPQADPAPTPPPPEAAPEVEAPEAQPAPVHEAPEPPSEPAPAKSPGDIMDAIRAVICGNPHLSYKLVKQELPREVALEYTWTEVSRMARPMYQLVGVQVQMGPRNSIVDRALYLSECARLGVEPVQATTQKKPVSKKSTKATRKPAAPKAAPPEPPTVPAPPAEPAATPDLAQRSLGEFLQDIRDYMARSGVTKLVVTAESFNIKGTTPEEAT